VPQPLQSKHHRLAVEEFSSGVLKQNPLFAPARRGYGCGHDRAGAYLMHDCLILFLIGKSDKA
jgi:hypothetical protein